MGTKIIDGSLEVKGNLIADNLNLDIPVSTNSTVGGVKTSKFTSGQHDFNSPIQVDGTGKGYVAVPFGDIELSWEYIGDWIAGGEYELQEGEDESSIALALARPSSEGKIAKDARTLRVKSLTLPKVSTYADGVMTPELLRELNTATTSVTTLTSSVATLNTDVSTLNTEVSVLNSSLTSLDSRESSHYTSCVSMLNMHTTQIGEMSERLSGDENQIGTLDNRLTSAENQIGTLDNRLTSAENQVGTLDTRLTGTENNITALDNRLPSGYSISVVPALPSTPDEATIYIIKGE